MAQAVIHGFTVTQAEGLTDEQRANVHLWVGRLRFGGKQQTRLKLRGAQGYCCLGIAEDAIGCTWKGREAFHGDDDSSFNELTEYGVEALGQPSPAGFSVIGKRGDSYNLAQLNDVRRVKFPKIADIIAYWAGLENPAADTTKGEEDPKVADRG